MHVPLLVCLFVGKVINVSFSRLAYVQTIDNCNARTKWGDIRSFA